MKSTLFAILIAVSCDMYAGIPDSVYVKPHGNAKGEGMFLEWSADGKQWSKSIREAVVTSDYGPWGSGKKLYNPSLTVGSDGLIALVFEVGLEKKPEKDESKEKAHNNKSKPSDKKVQPKREKFNQFAVACSYDMVHWRPQDFPYMEGVGQCLSPQITYSDGKYEVTFHNKENVYYSTTTTDLINFTSPVQVQKCEKDSVIRLPYSLVERLSDAEYAYMPRAKRNSELARDDAQRFDTLRSLKAEVTVDASSPKAISDKLMGIFFEDINYSADGGLCAELVQNGDFEYTASENHEAKKQHIQWNRTTAWSVKGNLTLDTLVQGVSANNPHAVALKVAANQLGASIRNEGWDGIPLNKGAKYDLSLYLKGGEVKVSLMKGNKTLASATLSGADSWKKVEATLVPSADCDSAVLDIRPLTAGEVAIDMVSLMPQDTYKGHGLRRDLAETLEALHPKFMRFPGGCLVHGDGLENMYHWKETIGPLEDRKPQRNLWNYHQSRRIGYYEFFQMCEDMGMEPLPVLAAGVPCANSSVGGNGQQGGIPMEEMGAYVQDVLDLIEWANGDASTEWGRKRIEQGHEKPFNLKMIGIGNEDLISPTFTERYLMLCKAVKERYPDMVICGTAGPFYYGSDYDEGWKVATEHHDIIDMVDEHYYLPPGWYIHNQDFYDQYDRTGPKVYLGEWAAHGPGRKSTIETALAEALYYCSLERNADIVVMSSYAPLLAREHHTQWSPDMIYYNNREVKPTVGYFTQKMCGNSPGDQYLESSITTKVKQSGVKERLAVSTVRDSKTGKTYMKIVNLLPVRVDTHVQLKGLLDGEKTCKTTTLTGKYDSTKARPVEGTATLSPDCHLDLPAYSFTLIEL